MKTQGTSSEIENANAVRLSEIIEKRYIVQLTCPDCRRSLIVNGSLFSEQEGDPTLGDLSKTLRCDKRRGCGRLGLEARLEALPDLKSS